MNLVPLKFLILPTVQLIAIAGLWLGAGWTFTGAALLAFLALACDHIEDRSDVDDLLDIAIFGKALLYFSIVLQTVLIFSALQVGASGESLIASFGAFLTMGILTASAFGNIGHELAHSPKTADQEIARFMFAVCLHSATAIDHVYNHHSHVGTDDDPTTARRGETFWRYLRRIFIQVNVNSARFEVKRATLKQHLTWGLRNRFVRGHVYELIYLFAVAWTFGWEGVLIAFLAALVAIRAIEGFNFVAHYGLVRVPGANCHSRHCWNSRRLLSSGFMFNITSHSEHHMHPSSDYWTLNADIDSPMLPKGPVVMQVLSAFPQAWKRVMDPALAEWDRRFASPDELDLIKKHFA